MVAVANRSPRRPWHPWALCGIVVVAVVLRFHDLSAQSYWLEELWGIETAAGHGADHLALPTGRPLGPAPDLTHLSAARPIWTLRPQLAVRAAVLYLAVSHYAGPPTGPVMLLEHPASAPQMSLFRNPKVVWRVAHPDVAFVPGWLPGYAATVGQTVPHVGVLMRMERK